MAGIPKSKRSGGPKTEVGKAASSQNSLQTGFYSNIVVLPGELESDFHQLECQFIKDFSPQDIAEMTMVRELAAVVWKKLRLERLEQSAILIRLNEPIQDQEYRSEGLSFEDSIRRWVDHLDDLTAKFVNLQLKLSDQALIYLDKKLTLTELQQMKIKHTELYNNLVDQATEGVSLFSEGKPTLYQLDSLVITPDANESKRSSNNELVPEEEIKFVEFAVKKAFSDTKDFFWVKRNEEQIKAAITRIKEKRLMKLMELEAPQRIKDDLNRIFFRTLAELRKHQQWRQTKNTVDVTPKTTKNKD